jgi:hypothetical protein
MTDDLVCACLVAKARGADFPTVWRTILKAHPMVLGIPVQTITETRAQLEVALITGERLIYDSDHDDYTLGAPARHG